MYLPVCLLHWRRLRCLLVVLVGSLSIQFAAGALGRRRVGMMSEERSYLGRRGHWRFFGGPSLRNEAMRLQLNGSRFTFVHSYEVSRVANERNLDGTPELQKLE